MASDKEELLIKPSYNFFYAGSMKGSIFTLMTSTLGAGILSLPVAMQASGVIWGSMQFAFSGILSFYTTYLIMRACESSGFKTYMSLLRNAFPLGSSDQKLFYAFGRVVLFLNNLGCIVSYVVLENKLFSKGSELLGIQNYFLIDPNGKFWASVVIMGIVYPLSFARQFSQLNMVFAIGVAFMVYVVIVIVVLSFYPVHGDYTSNWSEMQFFNFSGTVKTMGIAIFAYACHCNVPDIYSVCLYS